MNLKITGNKQRLRYLKRLRRKILRARPAAVEARRIANEVR